MSFIKGIEKLAVKFKIGDIVKAVENREAKVKKLLDKAVKGDKRKTEKFSPSAGWMRKQVDHPLSKEIKDHAIDRNIDPDTLVGGHSKYKNMRERVLGRKLEHVKVLAKKTRDPIGSIKTDIGLMAKRKQHYAERWADRSSQLSEIKKKLKSKSKGKK